MGERGFVDVEDGSLYFERDGDGPPLVLLAGGMLDVRLWEAQVEPLSQAVTLIRCDLRGYGRSSVPTGPYRHCDDVRVLLDRLGIERAWIGGQSLGAGLAIDFALAFPESVAGLIMAPALPVIGWRWVEGFPPEPALKLVRTEGVDAAKAAFLELPLNASAMEHPAVAAALGRMVVDYSGWHLRHPDPGTFEAPDAVSRLGEIAAPALVLVGGRDVPDARLIAERLAADLDRVEHHLIDHVGHYPNLEDPALFNSLVLGFLDAGE